MITLTVLGLLLGGGLVLVARALRPPPMRLAPVINRLNRPYAPVHAAQADSTSAHRDLQVRLAGAKWFDRLRGSVPVGVQRDLRILGRTVDRHVFDKLTGAAGLLLAPTLYLRLMRMIGMSVPGGFVASTVCGLFAAVLGFMLPDLLLRSQAKARRQSFEHALSSYVDLVNVLLAGGAGIETALEAAAEAGDGPAFRELRTTLVRARAMRRSHWDAFGELGTELGVEPLNELAASMQLAGEQGARVRLSLAAKAASLRARQMGQIEAAANAASERIGLPVALMFLGLLGLMIFPALSQITGT